MYNIQANSGPFAGDWGASAIEDHNYFVTFSGYPFDVTDPSTWTYDHRAQRTDIAQSLANLCRFNGHTHYYSVAEHSVWVSLLLRDQGYSPEVQRLGLWHDATEAYVGDIPRPYKHLVSIAGVPFEEVEDRMAMQLFAHFSILYSKSLWEAVKAADMEVYYLEREQRPRVSSNSTHGELPSLAGFGWLQRDYELSKWE